MVAAFRRRDRRRNDHQSPERLNSSCIRSTIVATACLHLSRSAFPNFIPLMAQFTSVRDFAVARSTKTPMNNSQEGSNVLTASVIANCKTVEEISSRPLFFFLGRGGISVYSSTEETSPKNSGAFRYGSNFGRTHARSPVRWQSNLYWLG
jgi:hypothetical protein